MTADSRLRVSRATLVYEVVQREFRLAMIEHARRTLKKAYGTRWLAELSRPFGDKWHEMKAAAEGHRIGAAVDAAASDEFDYLGVERFFTLAESHFRILFPAVSALQEPQRSAARGSIMRWLLQVKDVRNPMSHPVDEDFTYADAFMAMDTCRRILVHVDDRVAERVAQIQEQLTLQELGPSETDAHSALDGALPAKETMAGEFVGRRAELADLAKWLSDPSSRRWALAGEGGKGKTALAYIFAETARDDAPSHLKYLIWLSAKKRQFVEGVVIEIANPDFVDLGSALDKILELYGVSDYADWDLRAKRLTVLELLTKTPALLVVDDIDAVEGSAEDAIEFFTTDVTRTPSKVLLTSRRILFGLANSTTQIQGLVGEEAEEFMNSRIELMQLDPAAFAPQTRAEILQATEGSPLYVEDLLRLCATGVSAAEAIRRWRQSSGDAARRYALEREYQKLSRAARLVLLACALNPVPASVADLKLITNLDDGEIHSALAELQRLYLVPKPKLIESLERFDLNVNVAALVRLVMRGTPEFRETEAAILQLSDEVIARSRTRRDVLEYLRQGVALAHRGEFDKAEEVLRAGLSNHPNEADILGQLGWLYSKWPEGPRLADARENFRRAADLRCRQWDMYLHWIDMEARLRNWPAAIAAAEAALNVRPADPQFEQRAGYVHSRLGEELFRQNAPARARDELRLSNSFFFRVIGHPFESTPRGIRPRSMSYKGLVRNYELLGVPDEAARLLSAWANEPNDQRALDEERNRFLSRRPDLAKIVRGN